MTVEQKDITTNQLRALSAISLLILALATMFFQKSDSTIDIVLIALASFLVGGAILSGGTNKLNTIYEPKEPTTTSP
jgi:hypothetical protein